MKIFRTTTRFSALLLLLLTVHIIAHTLLLPKHELISLQEQAVSTAFISTDSDNSDNAETRMGNFKPPKHSFVDYSTFFAPKNLLPAYNPVVSRLLPHEPFQALPKVYLDIIVPPDNLS